MKLIIGFIAVFASTLVFAQPRDLTPNKRSSAFGSRDFRDLRGVGLQIQIGPTYLMTNRKNELVEVTNNISAVSEETAAATDEVNSSMDEQTKAVEEVAKSAERLNSLSMKLNQHIEIFKI